MRERERQREKISKHFQLKSKPQFTYSFYQLGLSVMSSPRVGAVTKAYSQIIIDRNDNPNGIIELSASEIQVTEDDVNPFLMAVRREGLYGMVSVPCPC